MNAPRTPSYRFGPFTLIPSEGVLLKDGQPIVLPPKAFDLLAFFVANADRLLPKSELLHAVWPDVVVEPSNLAYNVFAIRKALGEPDGEPIIEAVPRRGYRFVARVVRTDGGECVRFQDPVFGRLAESGMFAISPNGEHLVYGTEGPEGKLRLWVRSMSRLEPFPLPGTEVFTILPPTFWSPDSRAIAFQAGGLLKVARLSGGAPQTVCRIESAAVGGSWSRDDVILIGNASGGVLKCSLSGASPIAVTTPGQSEIDLFPSFLSDGRRFLFLRVSRSQPEASGVFIGDLETPASPGPRLISTGFGAAYVPAVDGPNGFVVFTQDGSLFAQVFDEQRLELSRAPMKLAERLGSYLDSAFFAASAKTLVHRSPDPDRQLVWYSRQGQELGHVGTADRFVGLALSPDARRAIVARHVPTSTVDQDLWLFDLTRDSPPRRMTFEPTLEYWPVWATNETFVFGCGGGESGIYAQHVAGRRERLLQTGTTEFPCSVTPDLQTIFYATVAEPRMGLDIWVQVGRDDAAVRTPFIEREFDQGQAMLSPDGRWVAYVSNEQGPTEVFVTEVRRERDTGHVTAGESVLVSHGGGHAPRWRSDGQELFYLTGDGSVMAIEVHAESGFRPGPPQRLFQLANVLPEWGVTADGERFLFAVPVSPPPPFTIMRDWQAMLLGGTTSSRL